MYIYIEGVTKKDAKKFPVMAEDSYVSATFNVGGKPKTHEPPVSQRCKMDMGLLLTWKTQYQSAHASATTFQREKMLQYNLPPLSLKTQNCFPIPVM